MKKSYAVIMCCLILAPAHGLAADMAAFPLQEQPSGSQPLVEIGSGWYIRGDIGASLDETPTLSFAQSSLLDPPPPASLSSLFGSNSSQANFVAGLGGGYKFNSYIRADATLDYRTGTGFSSTTGGIICPYTATGLTSQTQLSASGTPVELGYAYNPNDTCNAALKIVQHDYTGLANAYVDLFTYWGVTPYVGAGAGLNIQSTSGSLNYTKTSDGTQYAANLSQTGTYPLVWVNPATGAPISPQPKIAFAPQNWNRTISSVKYSPAFALMAGVGIELTPNATLDLSYRYLNLGSSSTTINTQTGATLSQRSTAQEARIGIRYMPD